MALIIADRVVESSTTTGTGAFSLAGAVTGYRRFSAVCSTSDTLYYCIEAIDANGNPSGDWETGLGTYSSANTLTRTSVSASSNANAAVNFAAGSKRVSLNATATHISALQPLDSDLTALAGLSGVQGDVIYRDGSQWQRLAAGTAGQVLKTGGAGANPSWASAYPTFSGCKTRKSANLTAQNLTSFTPVTFNSDDYDTDSYHDTSSNTDRMTPPATGYYLVHATAEVANITTGNWIRIVVGKFDSGGSYLKDIAVQQMELSVTGQFQLSCSCVEPLTLGEYVKMHIQVEADTSVDITTGTWFSMTRVA